MRDCLDLASASGAAALRAYPSRAHADSLFHLDLCLPPEPFLATTILPVAVLPCVFPHESSSPQDYAFPTLRYQSCMRLAHKRSALITSLTASCPPSGPLPLTSGIYVCFREN
jgi:hypothetical protein